MAGRTAKIPTRLVGPRAAASGTRRATGAGTPSRLARAAPQRFGVKAAVVTGLALGIALSACASLRDFGNAVAPQAAHQEQAGENPGCTALALDRGSGVTTSGPCSDAAYVLTQVLTGSPR